MIPVNKKEYKIGQNINRCTFIEEIESIKYSDGSVIRKGIFKCDCGKIFITIINGVFSGKTKSCGCLRLETFKKMTTKHELCKTPEYNSWTNMKARCLNSNDKCYKNYGGRGITVCERWKNSFENFIEDMGYKFSKECSIERIDNNGNYCPENCKWSTRKEQSHNKRNNVYITYKEDTKILKDWATIYNMDRMTLKWRLQKGMSIEDALTTPTDLRFKIKNKNKHELLL